MISDANCKRKGLSARQIFTEEMVAATAGQTLVLKYLETVVVNLFINIYI